MRSPLRPLIGAVDADSDATEFGASEFGTLRAKVAWSSHFGDVTVEGEGALAEDTTGCTMALQRTLLSS